MKCKTNLFGLDRGVVGMKVYCKPLKSSEVKLHNGLCLTDNKWLYHLFDVTL